MPLLPGKAASHHRPHEGQTLKFIKELSANISCVNATAELPSSLHLRRPYTWFLWGISEMSSSQDKALPPCSAQEKGQDISTLKAVNGAGVEPIWKSLIFSVSASQAAAAASSSSRAQSVSVFLRKQLEPGWGKTCSFFLYSPSSKSLPDQASSVTTPNITRTHLSRSRWMRCSLLHPVACLPSVLAAGEGQAASSLASASAPSPMQRAPLYLPFISGCLKFPR